MINITSINGKVANGGATEKGVLTSENWNLLISAVIELQELVGTAGSAVKYKGAAVPGKEFYKNDIVGHDNALYICMVDGPVTVNDLLPDEEGAETVWRFLATAILPDEIANNTKYVNEQLDHQDKEIKKVQTRLESLEQTGIGSPETISLDNERGELNLTYYNDSGVSSEDSTIDPATGEVTIGYK